MQHSMRANLPDIRDAALVAEWEAKDPLPRLEGLLRELGELDDERLEAIEHDVEREVESAIETALADPDARSRRPPARGARARSGAIRSPTVETERDARLRRRGARGARARARGRSGRDPDGRGHRHRRRDLPRHRGSPGAVRPRARPRHAALRERLRRLRDRRRPDGAAAGRRAAVLRLRRRRLRPDHEPGREAPVHDGRDAEHPARHPDGLGRRRPPRRAALAEPRGALRASPGPRRRDALEPLRRQGPPLRGDPGRQPGDLPRAEAALLRRARARAARSGTGSSSASGASSARGRT